MPRLTALILATATLAATAAVSSAQTTEPTGPAASTYTQSQAAPIERAYPNNSSNPNGYGDVYAAPDQANSSQNYQGYQNEAAPPPPPPGPNQAGPQNFQQQQRFQHVDRQAVLAPGQELATRGRVAIARPAQGVYVRIARHSAVREVSASADRTELSVERGLVNVEVHDPVHHSLIQVDLPGGQVSLLKNGLYSFNAATGTVRVFKGEAAAFITGAPNAKPIKVKEQHELAFNAASGTTNQAALRTHEFAPQQGMADLIPAPYAQNDEGGYGDYGYAPYGFYGGYPYYAYGYPWGWGYPYGAYGYPYIGVGLGFGYYGGFHGGYFGRGGYGGHGRR